MFGLARNRAHDRLIGEDETMLRESVHNLVADGDKPAPRGFALRRRGVHGKAVAAGAFGLFQRFLSAEHRFLAGTGAAWQPDGADRDAGRDGTRARFDDFTAHGGMQPLGNDRHLALATFGQDQAEFVARGTADHVGGPQGLGESLPRRDNDFVGDFEAIGLVDHRKIIDRRHDIGAGTPFAGGAQDHPRKLFAKPCAIQMPGQFVASGQIEKPGQGLFLLGDLAHHAGNAFGAAIGSGSPHPGDLEPFA